jgi:hypothetical protein
VESPLPNLTFGAPSMQKNLPHHFCDVDCLQLREKKLRMVWTPFADLTLSDSGVMDLHLRVGFDGLNLCTRTTL